MSRNGLYKNRKAFDIDFYYFAPILLLYPSTPVEDLFSISDSRAKGADGKSEQSRRLRERGRTNPLRHRLKREVMRGKLI
jgi:hypothetical protein